MTAWRRIQRDSLILGAEERAREPVSMSSPGQGGYHGAVRPVDAGSSVAESAYGGEEFRPPDMNNRVLRGKE